MHRSSVIISVSSALLSGCVTTELPRSTEDETAAIGGARVERSNGQAQEKHCYHLDDDVLTASILLDIGPDGDVSGVYQGTIHHEKAGYFSGYRQLVTGRRDDDQLDVRIESWIEYDRQVRDERWLIAGEELDTGREVLAAADCAMVEQRFAETGTVFSDILETRDPRIHARPLTFDEGTFGTTVSSAVIRGDRDVYVLPASGGQEMVLTISSLENNAVFDVVSPSRMRLARETRDARLPLPHTGDYQVIVGGTRGNATYTLNITIR